MLITQSKDNGKGDIVRIPAFITNHHPERHKYQR
jgi:hypothetical protein